MEPWAQTVVCGRARVGGVPVGVIAVETRSVEVTMPADPANLDSEAKVINIIIVIEKYTSIVNVDRLYNKLAKYGIQIPHIKQRKRLKILVGKSYR